MSNKTINDYTAAGSIDGAADYFLLEQNNTYFKINRNTINGVSGQPADISTIQNITNKVLDNTNTITLKDSLFTLQDNSDTTKQAQFQLSGITTATTRTYTLPNASSTLADLSTAQILTNKALTDPAITGGTIDNSTVTVDAVNGHTSATVVSVANLSISNGVLNSNNSVVTSNITDSAVTPAKLQSGTGAGWSFQSYSPVWTNLTVGNGTVAAKYIQIGKTVIVRLQFTMGSTSVVTGSVAFALPVTANAAYSTLQTSIGSLHLDDVGVAGYMGSFQLIGSTTVCSIYCQNSSATYVTEQPVNATVPWTIATGDFFAGQLIYEAA